MFYVFFYISMLMLLIFGYRFKKWLINEIVINCYNNIIYLSLFMIRIVFEILCDF